MGQDIENRKNVRPRAIPLAFYEESRVNFGPLSTEFGPTEMDCFRRVYVGHSTGEATFNESMPT